jgi:hypothetical protein
MAILPSKFKGNVVIEGTSATVNGVEVLKESTSQTITNKTIDADLNTISNIDNADIKAGAAIDASKIADGSVSSAEFQRLDGVTSNIQTQLDNKIESSEKGASNGVATLDSGGKIPAAQLPNTVMDYRGNWNANTNTPTLADGTGNAGDVYRVNVAGTQDLGSGSQAFAIGDWVVYNGTIWEKSNNSNAVVSVNGLQGVVVLDTDDIAEGANLYFTDERAQDAVGSILTDSSKIDFTYDDVANTITATVVSGSLVNTDISSTAAISYSKLNLSNSIVDVDVAPSAGINVSKLADGSVGNVEFQRLSGVTSPIQTQIDGKQPLDATLTSLAAYNTNGFVVQTASDTFAGRSIVAGSSKIAIVDGNGVAGNPSVDVNEANLSLANIGGTLPISKGGTGQTTAVDAFDALAPSTTKGDIIVHNGTDNVRLSVGANGQALVADSSTATGLKYAAIAAVSAGDIAETSFVLANNQSSFTNVTGFLFSDTVVRGFTALVTVDVDATTDLSETFTITGINRRNGGFAISVQAVGDSSGVTFDITSAGQIQYTSSNYTGFVSGSIKFRAITVSV